MKTEYLPSFIKDLKDLKSSSVFQSIRSLVFEYIPKIETLPEIKHLKKLKGEGNAYRIRIGDYRIGVFILGEKITFSRVFLHRRDIYRYFPRS